MKYFCTCFILFTFVSTLCSKAQDSPVFNLVSVSTNASTASVSVKANGFCNIASGNLKITYDPAVAVPVVVTKGPDLAGTFAYNLADTGIIRIGWFTYPPVTLTDSSVIFDIKFSKVRNGTCIIKFDDGTYSPMDCQFNNGSHQKLNDEPFSSYYLAGLLTFHEPAGPVTTAPMITATPDEDITVPITVTGFNNVGAVSLRLEYDPAVLDFRTAENTGGFPDMVINYPKPGTINVSGTVNDPEGFSLPDKTVFCTLNFHYLGGSTMLSWNDIDGHSCSYSGPQSAFIFTDTPQSDYYISGKVAQSAAPDAPTVSLTHPTCSISTGTIEVTSPLGEEYTYSIDGNNYQPSPLFSDLFTGTYNLTVKTNVGAISSATSAAIGEQPLTPAKPSIKVTAATCGAMGSAILENYNPAYTYTYFPEGPVAGAGGELTGFTAGQSYTVTATGNDGCESILSEPFLLEDRLEAPVPVVVTEHLNDGTVILTAGEGARYLWSTGETTRSILPTATGEYFVEVIYTNGCSAVSETLAIIVSSTPHIEAAKAFKIKAYPNPFSERLLIEFTSPESAPAYLEICDMYGRPVKNILNHKVRAGRVYKVEFIPENRSGTVYLYKLAIGNTVYSGKVMHSKQ